jgi:hypothetical protein
MTADTLRYFVEQLRSTIPDGLHPACQTTIHERMQEMRRAAENGDTATITMLAKRIEAVIEQELQWERENSARPGGRPGRPLHSRDAP